MADGEMEIWWLRPGDDCWTIAAFPFAAFGCPTHDAALNSGASGAGVCLPLMPGGYLETPLHCFSLRMARRLGNL
jgi:hypothetical protein